MRCGEWSVAVLGGVEREVRCGDSERWGVSEAYEQRDWMENGEKKKTLGILEIYSKSKL